MGTRPSAHMRTASEESLTVWCLEDLLPLIHMTADLRVANDSLHLNEGTVGRVTFEGK